MAIEDLRSEFQDAFKGIDLGDALSSLSSNTQASRLLRQNASLEEKMLEEGLDPSLTEPRENFFMEFLNFIDKPKQIVQGVLDAAFIKGDLEELSEGGLIPDLIAAGSRGLDERTNAFDILRRETDMNPWARGALGLFGEVITDPLNLISFGGASALKAGGKKLTKEGGEFLAKRVASYTDDLIKEGVPFKEAWNIADSSIDDALGLAAKYSDNLAKASAEKVPEVKAALLAQASTQSDKIKSVLGTDDLFTLDSLFEADKKLEIGLNLPFLGHLSGSKYTKETKEALKGAGITKKALAAAGEVINPAYVGTTVNLSEAYKKIPEPLKAVVQLGQESAAKFSGRIDDYVNALPKESVQYKALDLGKAINRTFAKTFNEKALVGKRFEDLRDSHRNAVAAFPSTVARDILQELPPEISDDILKEAGLGLDALSGSILNKLKDNAQGVDIDAFDELLRRTELGEYVDPTEWSRMFGIADADATKMLDDVIEQSVRVAAQENPQILSAMQSVQKLLRTQRQKEIDAGVSVGNFLEFYLPHRYINRTGQVASKKRKYATVAEAFEKGGLAANTNVRDIVHQYMVASERRIANKKLFERATLEFGLPREEFARMMQVANGDPSDPRVLAVRKALRRDGYNLDRPLTLEAYEEAKANAAKVRHLGDKINDTVRDYSEELTGSLASNGIMARDVLQPNHKLGELGTYIVDEDMVLPDELAQALTEITQRKDGLREAFKGFFGKEHGDKLIGYIDGVNAFTKRWLTLPFPSYWSRNAIGENMLGVMERGFVNMDPGNFAETAMIISGNGALKTKTGTKIPANVIQEAMKRNGMQFSDNTFLDIFSFADEHNMEKMLLQADAVKALKGGNVKKFLEQKGVRRAATGQVMRDKFENFYRINHFIQNLKDGGSIADAVRITNDQLINYRQLSPIEQSLMRRMFLFYGFNSKAVKKGLANMVGNPGAIQRQLKSARAIAEIFTEPDAAPTLEEHEDNIFKSLNATEQISFPVGKSESGKPVTGRGFGLPFDSVLQTLSVQTPRSLSPSELTNTFLDSAARTIQKTAAQSNPWMKATLERMSGKNLFFDAPIDSTFASRLPDFESIGATISRFSFDAIPEEEMKALGKDANKLAKEYLKLRPDGKGHLIADPGMYWLVTSVLPGMGRLVNSAKTITDEDLTSGQKWLESLSGVRIEEQDPERSMLYRQIADKQKELRRAGL